MLDAVFLASSVHRMVGANRAEAEGERASRVAADVRTQNEFIKCDVEKLFMLTEALWTVLKEQHGYTDEDLVQRLQEIDMRDGRLDGKVAKEKVIPDCPECGRKLMCQRPVCLYCGAELALDPFQR